MKNLPLKTLEKFIVRAKKSTYVGEGQTLLSYRLGSKDLQFFDGDWTYHDSYFGESDFIGEEIVYYHKQPVWGMNYFGYILRLEKITSAQAGQMIKKSLSKMYAKGRFLGGFEYAHGHLKYVDLNDGDMCRFRGKEQIYYDDKIVYELVYHGGLIRS